MYSLNYPWPFNVTWSLITCVPVGIIRFLDQLWGGIINLSIHRQTLVSLRGKMKATFLDVRSIVKILFWSQCPSEFTRHMALLWTARVIWFSVRMFVVFLCFPTATHSYNNAESHRESHGAAVCSQTCRIASRSVSAPHRESLSRSQLF